MLRTQDKRLHLGSVLGKIPARFAPAELASVGLDATITAGTNVASNASANTKGSWVELTASAPIDADGFYLIVSDTTTHSHLIDIGLGGAGSEQVLLENFLFATGGTDNIGIASVFIPLPIEAGTRIAARSQSSGASGSVRVLLTLAAGGLAAALRLSRATTYGANTADSGGTQVDPGASTNTKGAYAEVSASLTNSFSCCIACFGNQGLTDKNSGRWAMDLALGAAASEAVFVPNVYFRLIEANLRNDSFEPSASPLLFASAEAGQRLAARAQSSINQATDRLFDVVVIGFD